MIKRITIGTAFLIAIALGYFACNSKSNPTSSTTTGQWSTVFEDSFNRADGPIGSNYTTQLGQNTNATIGITGNKLLISGPAFWAVRYGSAVSYQRFRVSVRCSTTTDTAGYQFAVDAKSADVANNWVVQKGYLGGYAPDSSTLGISRLDAIDTTGGYSVMHTLASKTTRLAVSAGKWYFLSLEVNGTLLVTVIQDIAAGVSDTVSVTDSKAGVDGSIASMNGEQMGNNSTIYLKDFKIEKYE